MNSKFLTYAVYFILVLAVIGIISNPGLMIREILITLVVVGLLILVFRYMTAPKSQSRKEQINFVKAARKSKKRIQKKLSAKKPMYKSKQSIRKRDARHLTVIEGKKGKKKNRALH